jgi:putative ABC transport system permease protein
MSDSLYLAWRYLLWHRGRSAVLVACVTLITVLPLGLQLLLAESERQLAERAETTPLLLGARGSALDLVMNSLYFGEAQPEAIDMGAWHNLRDTGLVDPVPLYVRFSARGHRIVGTTLDYFDKRGLEIASGRQMALLGEAVLGAAAARKLGLGPGDDLVSSPETLFDLAGIYPLKMRVVGVLAPSHGPDDLAVFVDIKSAWVIEGLGHGHQDLARIEDPTLVVRQQDGATVGTAKLPLFTEITDANIDSFHFHGDPGIYPLTAVIAFPDDTRAGTLLRGRYLEDPEHQVVQPRAVIDDLLDEVFRIKRLLDGVLAIVGGATLLAIVLVFSLSLRLRQREITTIFRLGCSRGTLTRLLAAEIGLIVVASAVVGGVLLMLLGHYSDVLVRLLLVR